MRRAALYTLMSGTLLVSSASMVAGTAHAQSPNPTSNSATGDHTAPANGSAPTTNTSGDIIVTAQRREQSVQKVPIAITALSSDTIKQANLTDMLSFARLAPNTQVRVFAAAPNIFIRGVGLNDFNPSSVPPIAVYRDEFALIASAAQVYPLFDLERVEVLKGPQGTLFGKNTTGGAVSYISKRPGDAFEGYLTAGYGRFGERYFQGAVTLPVSDKFSLRVSGASRQTDGDRINLFDGKRGHRIDMQAGRIVAVFKPTEDIKMTTIGYIGQDHGDYPVPKTIGTLPGGTDALGYKDPFPNNPKYLNYDLNVRSHNKDIGVTNIIEANVGTVLIKSVTGYDKSRFQFAGDADDSPNQLDHVFILDRTREFTQELNISSHSKALEWIAGVYYSWDKVYYPVQVDLLGTLAPIGADLPLIINAGRTTRSYAGYGQATLTITDGLRATGGIRYTSDNLNSNVSTTLIHGYFDPNVTDGAPIPIIPERDVKQHFGKFSYRGAIEYDIAPRILGYISINHSFKQGGVYLTPLSSPHEADPFAPETNTAYETGVKSTLFNGLLRINVAGFFYDYKNIQAFAIGPTSSGIPSLTIQNAASAHIYGAETDFTVRPTKGLTFDGGLGWLHARYRKYPNAGTDLATGQPLDFSGHDLPDAPDWTGNIAATYNVDFAVDWHAMLRVDYNYVGRRSFDPSNARLVSDGSYGLVNARLTITPPGKQLDVALWGRNLGDTVYLQNATDLSSLGFIAQYYGDRRSYGVEATLHF